MRRVWRFTEEREARADVLFRPAVESDIPELLRIGHAFFAFNPYREHSKLDERSLAASLRHMMDSHLVLMAEVDGKVCGAAGAYIAPVYWNEADIQGLEAFWWIDPEYRKGGGGRALRTELEARAKAMGVRFWNMVALEDSMPAEVGAGYLRAGMRLVEHTYMKVI